MIQVLYNKIIINNDISFSQDEFVKIDSKYAILFDKIVYFSDDLKYEIINSNQRAISSDVKFLCEEINSKIDELKIIRESLNVKAVKEPTLDELKALKVSEINTLYATMQNISLVKTVNSKSVIVGSFPLQGDLYRDFQIKAANASEAKAVPFEVSGLTVNLTKSQFQALLDVYDIDYSIANRNTKNTLMSQVLSSASIVAVKSIDINIFKQAPDLNVSIFSL